MTLETALIRDIRAAGPLTVADYMTRCLLDPAHGYYTTRDPLGAGGDFITAPEVSQMFGELIGLALAQSWLDRGAPDPIRLVELGPGRGTLMADVLRATARVPGFHDALTLHLVEASPTLRARQRQTIAHPFTHHDRLDDVPDDAPLYLVANEFFDALPIRQFQRDGDAWRERVIGLNGDHLSFGLSDPTTPSALTDRLSDTKDGDIVELGALSEAITAQIAIRLMTLGGIALIVDYGDRHSLGDTLQAVKNHQMVSPLADPGSADLTAHVDFEALALAAELPGICAEMTTQGTFLERLGITQRAQALAKSLTGSPRDQHIAAHRRLTHPEEMGTLFKVLVLYEAGTPTPPGIAA